MRQTSFAGGSHHPSDAPTIDRSGEGAKAVAPAAARTRRDRGLAPPGTTSLVRGIATGVKRTFQVAVFGASDAANKKTLAALQRARGGELVTILNGTMGTVTSFFDHDV